MRLCIRLAAIAVLLVATGMGLIHMRTETNQAGNRLHRLFRQKRELEKECCRLELAIARLKSQERLREHAAALCGEVDHCEDERRGPAAPLGMGGPQARPAFGDRHPSAGR